MNMLTFLALDDLKDHLEHPRNLTEMKFLLLEQKYLELLAQQNIVEALKVSPSSTQGLAMIETLVASSGNLISSS